MTKVNDLSSGQYSVNKNIRFKTSMLRSDLLDNSDTYIVVKETIDLLADDANENDKAQKNVAFKNNAPVRSYISKNNSTLIDSEEDVDIVMPIYNLLEYIQRFCKYLEIYEIIIEMKLMMLMIMLQMVNRLNKKQK